jgi:hypothetical protein
MQKKLNTQLKKLKSQQLQQKETSLKTRIQANTTVTKGAKSNQEVLKAGNPLDHAIKHDAPEATRAKFGMSLGVTHNMKNYESLRVDAWCTEELRPNETFREGCIRLRAELEEVLEDTISDYDNN